MKKVMIALMLIPLVGCASKGSLRDFKAETREINDIQGEVMVDLQNNIDSNQLKHELDMEALNTKLDRMFKASLNK